jgi:hypothetical protein
MATRGKTPDAPRRDAAAPQDIGDDQAAGYHRGENFAPRNRGTDVREVADAQAAADARAREQRGARTGDETVDTPLEPSAWEARVERGEEWLEEEDVAERETPEQQEASVLRAPSPREE